MSNNKRCDILIVGGGLTGAILMLALVGKGYHTVLVDAHAPSDKIDPDFDARTLALSPASIKILDMLGIWSALKTEATAIESIHVSDQHHFGSTRLKGEKENPLGYVVEMQHINRTLFTLLKGKNYLAPARLVAFEEGVATLATSEGNLNLQPQLVVAADGTESLVRNFSQLPTKTHDFQQHALVANIGLARAHQGQAFERFTSSGPLALLPMTDKRASLVWALKPNEAAHLMSLSEPLFLEALQKAFGYRLGRFLRAGQRVIYPLRQVIMPKQVAWPFVFVGNAAHTLHPVAGQGFNLGLRDVATLAQCIIQYGLNEAMLAQYQELRAHDQRAIEGLTNNLVKLFTSRLPGIAFARSLGLIAIDTLPFLKTSLMHYARGFAGVTPDLVCGIALRSEGAN